MGGRAKPVLDRLRTSSCYTMGHRQFSCRRCLLSSSSTSYTLFPVFALLVFLSAASLAEEENEGAAGKVTYDGAQLFRVQINKHSKKKLEELEELGVAEKWRGSVNFQDMMVLSGKIDEAKTFLNSNNMTYNVIIEDIQRAISVENPEKIKHDRDKPYKLTFQRYHRFTDHLEFHDYLKKQYPNLVTVMEIGTSIEGRPIKVIKISSGKPNAKAIWIDGGIHAREWISPASVSYMISEFVENRAEHGNHITEVDFYIAPFLNPDGYEYSHTVDRLWRKNRNRNTGSGTCSGIDLNRNWGYRWGGAGSSRQPCKDIFAGSKAFSEPETAAVSRFVLANKDSIKAYVTFHSYGQYILYPWGYDRKVPPDYADLDRVARKAAKAIQAAGGPSYTVGNSAATLYAASGGADDWAKGAAGIKYTYTIELRDNGIYGFVLPAQFIEPTARDAMAAIKVIAEEVNKLP